MRDMDAVLEVADVVQIGARNMQNYPLLAEIGRSGCPALLKRGLSSTLDELLMAAEYILKEGNPNVMLCERGIRTFETAYRFTLDLMAVPVLKELSHLPVIVDPSHAAGRRDLVRPLSLAAAAVGADGIIVEVHPNPDEAICDGPQALRGGRVRGLRPRGRAGGGAGRQGAEHASDGRAPRDSAVEGRRPRGRADRRFDRPGGPRARGRTGRGYDRDAEVVLARALALGAIDAAAEAISEAAVAGADVVFVATPLSALAADRRATRSQHAGPRLRRQRRRLHQAPARRGAAPTSASSAATRSPAPRPPASSTPARTCSTARPGT